MKNIVPEPMGCTCRQSNRFGDTRRPHQIETPGLVSTLTAPIPVSSRANCTVHPLADR